MEQFSESFSQKGNQISLYPNRTPQTRAIVFIGGTNLRNLANALPTLYCTEKFAEKQVPGFKMQAFRECWSQ